MATKRNYSRRVLTVLVLCALSAASVHAQTWTVREYGGASAWTSEDGVPHPDGCVTVTGDPYYIITIVANPSRELKFEIYYADGAGDYVSEAPLNDFTIAPSVNAALIEISIFGDPDAEDPAHVYGASDVARMNLKPGSFGECRLKALKISGDLATAANAICDNITGDIFIGGALHEAGHTQVYTYDLEVDGSVGGDIYVGLNTYNTLDLGDVDSSSTITITKDLEGTLSANTLGNVLIYGDSQFIAVHGDIIIAQNYAGTITVDHKYDGKIQIGTTGTPANLAGVIYIRYPFNHDNNVEKGLIHITGDVTSGGQIDLDSNVTGDIQIDGNLDGVVSLGALTGTIDINSDSEGVIAVAGDLCNDINIGVDFGIETADYDRAKAST